MNYQVLLSPSGNRCVAKSGETVLSAATNAGLFLPYSCRSGVCRTCKGRVIKGQVDHGHSLGKALSSEERQQGYALLCSAKPVTDVTIEIAELSGLDTVKASTYPCRVAEITRPADDVAVLKLRLPLNETFFFRAGQYIDILLKDGVRRSYSIAVPPDPVSLTHIELHIRRHPGGLFTEHVFSALAQRDMLRFEGPFGSFFLRETAAKPVVLLAGGTGFAPIKAIVEYALQRDSLRQFHIYWGGRQRRDLYLADLPQKWAAERSNVRFEPVLSGPEIDADWTGRTGWVHRAVVEDFPDLSGYEVYACGAPAMVNAAREELTGQCSLPQEAFYADAFITQAETAKCG
ncbi:CDP-6-deoxy-delta-3,4-glucoseen reductase [Burkholderia gladioli pv. gladioli]|uniref:CDP-6-deoxy-delta-3,4-glucoseen reductase n=1 Tax=Burkholderia gladioli TaxID=28095 RepID=UPI0009B89BAA|nr:CDP-6-deoxy-delta-3,4-glucoseen reductase [Burkholderia gladioli]MDJ1164175.1 CDP-6-deoxy-delta-3,4-glucoseen reductase [Burkholderia gladioli pv. gladioli]